MNPCVFCGLHLPPGWHWCPECRAHLLGAVSSAYLLRRQEWLGGSSSVPVFSPGKGALRRIAQQKKRHQKELALLRQRQRRKALRRTLRQWKALVKSRRKRIEAVLESARLLREGADD